MKSDQYVIISVGGMIFLFGYKWIEAIREKDKMLKIHIPIFG